MEVSLPGHRVAHKMASRYREESKAITEAGGQREGRLPGRGECGDYRKGSWERDMTPPNLDQVQELCLILFSSLKI